jgi:hypothetical protein
VTGSSSTGRNSLASTERGTSTPRRECDALRVALVLLLLTSFFVPCVPGLLGLPILLPWLVDRDRTAHAQRVNFVLFCAAGIVQLGWAAVMLLLAVPGRQEMERSVCVGTLRLAHHAKEVVAALHHATNGQIVGWSEVLPAVSGRRGPDPGSGR